MLTVQVWVMPVLVLVGLVMKVCVGGAGVDCAGVGGTGVGAGAPTTVICPVITL